MINYHSKFHQLHFIGQDSIARTSSDKPRRHFVRTDSDNFSANARTPPSGNCVNRVSQTEINLSLSTEIHTFSKK
jgi:hypothetical protein